LERTSLRVAAYAHKLVQYSTETGAGTALFWIDASKQRHPVQLCTLLEAPSPKKPAQKTFQSAWSENKRTMHAPNDHTYENHAYSNTHVDPVDSTCSSLISDQPLFQEMQLSAHAGSSRVPLMMKPSLSSLTDEVSLSFCVLNFSVRLSARALSFSFSSILSVNP